MKRKTERERRRGGGGGLDKSDTLKRSLDMTALSKAQKSRCTCQWVCSQCRQKNHNINVLFFIEKLSDIFSL